MSSNRIIVLASLATLIFIGCATGNSPTKNSKTIDRTDSETTPAEIDEGLHSGPKKTSTNNVIQEDHRCTQNYKLSSQDEEVSSIIGLRWQLSGKRGSQRIRQRVIMGTICGSNDH